MLATAEQDFGLKLKEMVLLYHKIHGDDMDDRLATIGFVTEFSGDAWKGITLTLSDRVELMANAPRWKGTILPIVRRLSDDEHPNSYFIGGHYDTFLHVGKERILRSLNQLGYDHYARLVERVNASRIE